MSSVNSRTFSRIAFKRACTQVMIGIKDKESMFCQKSNFYRRQQIILHFSNNNFYAIRCQAHQQQLTALQLSPSVRSVQPSRCILCLSICIKCSDNLFFPSLIVSIIIAYIPSDYRFSFLFSKFLKIDHNFIV